MLRLQSKIIILIPVILLSEEIQINVSNKFTGYFYNDSLNFFNFRNNFLLNLNRNTKDLIYGMSLSFLMDNELVYDTIIINSISKKTFFIKTNCLTLKIGDSYLSSGRGIIASFFEDEKIRFERDIEGIIVNSNINFFDLKVFSGFPRINNIKDSVRRYSGIETNLNHKLVNIGLRYLMENASDNNFLQTFGSITQEIYGGSLKLNLNDVEFYGEYGERHTYGVYSPFYGWIGTEDVNGNAIYLSFSYTFSGFGANLLLKKYKDFNSGINSPPPCNHISRLLNEANDEKGYELIINFSPLNHINIDFDYSCSFSSDRNQFLKDFYNEIRYEIDDISVQCEIVKRNEKGLEYNVNSKNLIGGNITLTFDNFFETTITSGINLYNNEYIDEDLKYNEYIFEFEISPKDFLSIFSSLSKASKPVIEYENKSFWWEIGINLVFNDGRGEITFTNERTKGGLVCSGGICKYEPSFEGYKLNFNFSF
uniref:Uncharacterized protein n=1 Tax=candidate division WOR-3 bacterium TaxID=2052148 RepID=A0A7C4Y653_UNCW3